MTKTVAPTITQKLEDQIATILTAIAGTESHIAVLQTENEGLEEAISLLKNPQKYEPTPQQNELFHRLKEYVFQAESKQDSEFRWAAADSALSDGIKTMSILQQQLTDLRQGLTAAEEDLIWQQNYQPYVAKYQTVFTLPSPEVRKQEKITALGNDIADKQSRLQRAHEWLNASPTERGYYSGNAAEEIRYLNEALPILHGQLERLTSEPITQDRDYDQKLRQYIKARVEVQPALDAFLTVQQKYLLALEQFKTAIASHPVAAEFSAAAFTLPRIVTAESSIRLV